MEPVPPFSVVVNVAEGDREMVRTTLPSWIGLRPSEIILAVDWPASEALKGAILEGSRGDARVKVVEVRKDPSWHFHQANVRRTGFRAASNDRILTGDIDIRVNVNCLKAIMLVGNNEIGLASLSKRRAGGKLSDVVRNMNNKVLAVAAGRVRFTGLYALYRPYWLDSEVEEEVKSSPYPLSPGLLAGPDAFRGEDAILRDYMRLKHRVVILPDVGGEDLREAQGDRPVFQAKMGKKFFMDGRTFDYVFVRSLLYVRGQMLGSYLHYLAKEHGEAHVPVAIAEGMTRLAVTALMLSLGRIGLPVGQQKNSPP
jgi:hypothetical protein